MVGFFSGRVVLMFGRIHSSSSAPELSIQPPGRPAPTRIVARLPRRRLMGSCSLTKSDAGSFFHQCYFLNVIPGQFFSPKLRVCAFLGFHTSILYCAAPRKRIEGQQLILSAILS